MNGSDRPTPSKKARCSGADEAEANRRRTVASVKGKWGAAVESVQSGAFAMWDQFLAKKSRRTFTLSCMTFQDCFNIDLERLKNCCIHVVGPGGLLIPFCARYCTSLDGTPLYPER